MTTRFWNAICCTDGGGFRILWQKTSYCPKEVAMAQAKEGDGVKVHYTGKLEDGTVFDSSLDRGPLEFIIGTGGVIPGFEQAIIGMRPGERKTEKIPAEQAYGPHEPEMVFVVSRKRIPENLDPRVGQRLEIQRSDGRTAELSVIAVSETTVTMDGNHPLAGKELTFDLELVEIASSSLRE